MFWSSIAPSVGGEVSSGPGPRALLEKPQIQR
jgi:hypothetical protein